MTTGGTAAHAPEAQKTNVRTEKDNLHFHAEYFAENFDGIEDMATALLYDFCCRSSIVYGEGNSLQSFWDTYARDAALKSDVPYPFNRVKLKVFFGG
jgi:hypothetical protein